MRESYAVKRDGSDELTIAVFELVSESITERQRLFDTFRQAVRSWLDDTPLGQQAKEASSDDFNIADIETLDDEQDSNLAQHLRCHGIEHFILSAIVTDAQPMSCTFDDIFNV